MKLPTDDEILAVAILAVKNVIDVANRVAQGDPVFSELRKKFEATYKDRNNYTRFIDVHTHFLLVSALESKWPGQIEVYGEETKKQPPKSLANTRKLVVFIDPIDGTDLQDRDFSNWVSAMIFVVPSERRIVSVVGHSSGDIYFASKKGAFIQLRARFAGEKVRNKPLLCDQDSVVKLEEASVCFYGQKPKSFLSLARHVGFLEQMDAFKARMDADEELRIRLYNLGGNPMMVRIPSRKDNPGAVNVVFNLSGSQIYDVMPGAYIAVRSGAVFRDPLTNKEIDPLVPLLSPKERVRYILSGSRSLADELHGVLSKKSVQPVIHEPLLANPPPPVLI